MRLKQREMGHSLLAQWLGLCAFTAKDPGSTPGWELRSHNPNSTVPKKTNKQEKKLYKRKGK